MINEDEALEPIEDDEETALEVSAPGVPEISLVDIPVIDKTKPQRMVGDYVDFNDIIVTAPEEAPGRMYHRYFDMVQPRLNEIVLWRKEGLNYGQVANNLGLTRDMLRKYLDKFPELRMAMTFGKFKHRAEMVNTLHQLAKGFIIKLPRTKITKTGEKVDYFEPLYFQPNVQALIKVLESEYPEVYAAKQTVKHEGEFSFRALMDKVTEVEQAKRAEPLPPPDIS